MRAVNLLPPDLRTATRRGKGSGAPAADAPGGMGPFAVLGALAMCVIALAGYVLAGNTVKDRQAQLASVTAEQEATARQAEALKPYADFQSLAKTRVEGVKALAATRFDWHRALDDLSHALPADVTLETLSGTATPGAGDAAATAAPSIDLSGCTTADDGVARLMSSLGNVRGVTRVTLANADRSAKADDAEAGSSSPCGDSSSTFTVKIAFERAVAPAAATGAAAAAPATTTTTASTSEGTPAS
jgi:Tfp pilus assembly protein PilN